MNDTIYLVDTSKCFLPLSGALFSVSTMLDTFVVTVTSIAERAVVIRENVHAKTSDKTGIHKESTQTSDKRGIHDESTQTSDKTAIRKESTQTSDKRGIHKESKN